MGVPLSYGMALRGWYANAIPGPCDEVAQWKIPEANRQLCEADVTELEKGAAPKDEIWYGFGTGG